MDCYNEEESERHTRSLHLVIGRSAHDKRPTA
jgi:hypothetical protein